MRCDDLDALATWAEQAGGLLDEALWLGVEDAPRKGWRMVLASPTGREAPADPRDAFTSVTVPARRWTLTPVGGAPRPSAEDVQLPAEVGGLWALPGTGAGLAVDLGSVVVELPATAWEAEVGEAMALPVVRTPDPLEITWHGPGPVTAGPLAQALAEAGCAVTLYRNWAGSGQRFGSAFVKDALTPEAVASDERLGGAWRVAPAGVAAEDPRGVWLTGQSLAAAAYVTLHRTTGSDSALVSAACAALDGSPGLTWAHSGNTLVSDRDALAAWVRLLTPA
ncbi:MAG: hypothetical protein CVU56_17695 [Deltaproteobacteria bacterium HGW-Deltaproteobacteria-14]|jgi:hypothetical protein|nr:MAG: hypothetical protein CVU56_17695 [Deltaproteobacteria bacterium HGW-Deltaproteobacteria-14]